MKRKIVLALLAIPALAFAQQENLSDAYGHLSSAFSVLASQPNLPEPARQSLDKAKDSLLKAHKALAVQAQAPAQAQQPSGPYLVGNDPITAKANENLAKDYRKLQPAIDNIRNLPSGNSARDKNRRKVPWEDLHSLKGQSKEAVKQKLGAPDSADTSFSHDDGTLWYWSNNPDSGKSSHCGLWITKASGVELIKCNSYD